MSKKTQQIYFEKYLLEGPQEAVQYLSKIGGFQTEKNESKPSANLIETINDNDALQSTDDEKSNKNSDSDENSDYKKQISYAKRFERSQNIKNIQQELINKKYLDNNTQKDGIYGPITEKAIIKFQKDNQIQEQGVVGKLTQQQLFSQKKLSQNAQQQQQNKDNNKKLGGVSLEISKLPKVTGISTDSKSKQIQFLQSSGQKSDINLEDLAIGLYVYYNKDIKTKMISFSLDPYEETKPHGPHMRKVLYPDKLEGKNIIQNTKFSEILFEADYLLKKMSLGLEEDCKTQFKYPLALQGKGFKSIQELVDEKEKSQKQINNGSKQDQDKNWCRLWFVCRKVEAQKCGNSLKIINVKLGVDAKMMVTDKNGALKDSISQDKNDPSYIFASKMSDNFELLCEHYDIFKQLKQVYKAIALSKWIAMNQVPVDMKLIKNLVEQQRISNYKDKVNSIQQTLQKKESNEQKIEVSIETVAERGLIAQKIAVNDQNLKMAVKQIQEKEGKDKKFYDTKVFTSVFVRGVLGGVDMNFDINPTEISQTDLQTLPQPQKKQEATFSNLPRQQKQATEKLQFKQNINKTGNNAKKGDQYSDTSSFIGSDQSTQIGEQVSQDFQEKRIPFIFDPKEECQICKENLGFLEIRYPIENKFYCQIHHPMSCFRCKQIVQEGNKIKGNRQIYDSEYFSEQKEYFFHEDCLLQFQTEAQDQYFLKQQREHVKLVEKDVLTHIQKVVPSVKTLKELQIPIQQKQEFVCQMCKSMFSGQKQNNGVCCQVCGKADENRVNIAMKHKVEQLNAQMMKK